MQLVILGTAQWGLDYGITNTSGRLQDTALKELATEAWRCGIRTLDTAPSYGDAESRIGEFTDSFEVQTKVSAGNQGAPALRSSIQKSKKRLYRSSISAVLVHDWATLSSNRRREVAHIMESARQEGICRSVGVSAYEERDILLALEDFSRLDIVQAPVSILDQRLVGSDAVRQFRDAGGRFQARSVLLQGAALAPSEHLMFGHHPDVSRLRASGNALKLCMSYVASLPWVDEVVLAATSVAELNELMKSLRSPMHRDDWAYFASKDPWLIDPRRWTTPIQGE